MDFAISNIKSLPFVNIYSEPLVHLQIIPHFNVTNGRKIENIIDGLYSLQEPIFERIKFSNGQIHFKTDYIFYYRILLEKDKISFYYSVPKVYQDWFIQRVYAVWSGQVTIIPIFDPLNSINKEKSIQYYLYPKYKYFKSFVADYRENAPIPSILSVCKDLKTEDEKVLLELSFKTVDNWQDNFLTLQKKYRKGLISDKSVDGLTVKIFDGVFSIVDGLFAFMDILMEVKNPKKKYYYSRSDNQIEEYDPKKNELKLNSLRHKLSNASRQKVNYNGFKTNFRILSQSDNANREVFAKTLNVALKDIADDNEFTLSKKSKVKSLESPKINLYFNAHICSSKEIGQILQLPEKKWQEEYPVERVDTQEINLPKELFQNGAPIGDIKYKGKTYTANWNNKNIDIACLPKCVFGNQNTGKTKYLVKYAIESAKLDRGLFVLDGIKNCELADEIRDNLPKKFDDKIIELDFSNVENVIPLSWNELDINKFKKPNEKLKFSNNLAQELIKFLDSLTDEPSQKLSPRMKRFLSSAAMLTFSIPNTTIMDVLLCLTDYDERHGLIKKSNLPNDHKIIQDLLLLDDKAGDTKMSLVVGIIDRLDLLLGDYVLSLLFSTKGTQKIDFKHWIKNNYIVLCKMPQNELNDATIKTLTTFLISKIWFAKLMLGKNVTHTTVICDEVHRTSLRFENIREMRKFGLEYFFSAHQPADFKHILNTLKSAGCSFMLLNTTKENIKYFETEIKPFSIEEVLKTKKFHALCIVNYDREYITFNAKLPDLLDKSSYIDRSSLTDMCSRKYGSRVVGDIY